MQRRLTCGIAAAALSIAAPAALAQMSCAQLGSYLSGQVHISEVTTTLFTAGSPRCELDFTYSAKSGTADGYAEGQSQRIRIRVGLPRNPVDGGSGGAPGLGAWNGKLRNLGGGGGVGSLTSVTVATNGGYVGTFTDGGHTSAEIGASFAFGVIMPPSQPEFTLNYGKIRDFFADSLEQQFKWGLHLAQAYYGMPAQKNYWDGCSTGGRQGLYLAQNFGDQFDGFLVGAPAHYHMARRLSDGAPGMVQMELALKGKSISAGQRTAARDAAIAACDAMDGVTDGLLSDPRQCNFDARSNICNAPGAPAAPNCLDEDQAAAINKIWDGPRNAHGTRVMVPWDRNISFPAGATPGSSATQVIRWAYADLNYDASLVFIDEAARNAAGNPPGSLTFAEQAQLGSRLLGDVIDGRSVDLSKVKEHGAKIVLWHGGQDESSIRWALTLDYYTRAASFFNHGATPDYRGLHSWFRFFLAPGVGHCGGGPGPQPQGMFEAMVNWSENGTAPDSILSSGGGRTRPLCPFPQTAIYDGKGDPNLESSFRCGGDLQTQEMVCQDLIARYKRETEAGINTMGTYNLGACKKRHGGDG
jgi:hypothetical protein